MVTNGAADHEAQGGDQPERTGCTEGNGKRCADRHKGRQSDNVRQQRRPFVAIPQYPHVSANGGHGAQQPED